MTKAVHMQGLNDSPINRAHCFVCRLGQSGQPDPKFLGSAYASIKAERIGAFFPPYHSPARANLTQRQLLARAVRGL